MINDNLIKELLRNPVETRELLRCSLKNYISVMHYYLAREQFIFKPFHLEIIKSIEDLVFGRAEKQNLAISIAPRCGKSELLKDALSWGFTINPKGNNIYTSYSDKLILDFSGKVRDTVDSEFYKTIFNVSLKQDTASKALWKTNQDGVLMASALGGTITGFGAGVSSDEFGGFLAVDDPMKADDYKSETERQNVIDYYTATLKSRLNNKDKTPTILIMQRLHKNDLIGWLKQNEAELWKFIEVPAIDKNNNSIFPEKLSLKFLNKEKQIDPYTFWSQYMQQPIALGGNLIKSEWYKRYNVAPQEFDDLYIVCDTAFSKKESADFTAFMSIGIVGNNIYVLDVYNKRVDFPNLKIDLKSFFEKQKNTYNKTPNAIYIENKASGQSLLQELEGTGLPIKEIYPTVRNTELQREERADKLRRYNEVSTYIYDGYVWLPEVSGWVLDFLNQSESFDGLGDAHDDMIDTLIYGIKLSKEVRQIDWQNFKKVFSR